MQPSSVARYSLLGVPYSSKNFEYSTKEGKEINDSETYLIRISKARKNYMSNWALSPFIYNKLGNWYASDSTTRYTINPTQLSSTVTTFNLVSTY